MGCGGSKPIDLHEADGGMTADQCVAHHENTPGAKLTTEVTAFALKEKFFSISGEDFMVKDHKGTPLFRVSGTLFTLRDLMVMLDPATKKPIAMMRKKLIAINKTYKLFSSKPVYAGQTSEDEVEGQPFYEFAIIESPRIGRTVTYKLVTGKDQYKPLFTVAMPIMTSLNGAVVKKISDGTVVAKIGSSGLLREVISGSYTMEVCKNIDALGMAAFLITMDEMREGGSAISPLG